MPLPSDDALVKLADELVEAFKTLFGKHPGFRPAHAHGIMLTGEFTPTSEASSLSAAPQFNSPTVPITVRFSSSTGIPNIPDTDPNANPRGMALRFHLGGRKHTDIIGHSTPFFPTRTGAEFLEFFKAIMASPPGTPSPSPVEQFVGSHPSTLAFVTAPKPPPTSFAREAYYALTAFKFIAASGKETFVRYTIAPVLGVETLDDAALKDKSPTFLFDELPARIAAGPASFKLLAQLAEEGDVTDDNTVHWPDSRPVVELGTLRLDALVADNDKEQKYIIFDPIPRVEGIEPSADPLLELRAAIYLISGRQRRAA